MMREQPIRELQNPKAKISFGPIHVDYVVNHPLHNLDKNADMTAQKCLRFRASVVKPITGHDLLYYPALTRHLRAIQEYPEITREYPLDSSLSGVAFMKYLEETVNQCYALFAEAIELATTRINDLFLRYHHDCPNLVISDDAVVGIDGGTALFIDRILWQIDDGRLSTNGVRSLDKLVLIDLLKIDLSRYTHVSFEDYRVGTPWIAVRQYKHSDDMGDVIWYSLETRAPVTPAELKSIQTPIPPVTLEGFDLF